MTLTIHGWADWVDDDYPVRGVLINWYMIDTAVLHYTADDDLPDGDPGEIYSDIPKYLRAIQQSYVNFRGYAIGYNFAVDWLGGIWKLRGWDIRAAANLHHNYHTFTILCLVDGQDGTTLAADESIRSLIIEAGIRAAKPLIIRGHNFFAATGCPGKGITDKINNGTYNSYAPTPPELEINDMARLITPTDSGQFNDFAVFSLTGTFAEWIATENDTNGLVLTGTAEHDGVDGVPPARAYGVDRGFFKQYVLVGAAPHYPAGYAGAKTTPADFRKWVD